MAKLNNITFSVFASAIKKLIILDIKSPNSKRNKEEGVSHRVELRDKVSLKLSGGKILLC